jgi:NAD(P)H-hydrate repair Nnr-like enzyme with NAD(P)H-hydrate dehydratase domain
MATLLGIKKDEVSRDPAKCATNVAAELRCCVVLKSDTTYIAAPTGELWGHDGGVIGLATAGSGDVLAGIVTGLIARGSDPVTAALWGVFVHGKAGTILSTKVASVGFLAREILDLIPGLIARAGINIEHDRHGTRSQG